MDKSKWISLVVVASYVVVDLAVLSPWYHSTGASGSFPWQHGGCLLAFFGFASIWRRDIMGSVFLCLRFCPIAEPLEIIFKILGWILLALAVIVRVGFIRNFS